MSDTPNLDNHLDTVTITGVPIFTAGKYPQGEFDEAFLQKLAASYDPAFHEAPNYLTHEDAEGNRPAGHLALGWVKRLWVCGKTLFADMVNVPRAFAELLLAGRIKKRSVEIYHDLMGRGPYLRALAWPMIPQVKGLADVNASQVFTDEDGRFVSLQCDDHHLPQDVPGVQTSILEKETDMDKSNEPTGRDDALVTKGELQLIVKQLKDDLKAHQQQLAAAEQVRRFCEQMVLAGKMTPAERATEEPLLISQRQRELTETFAEDQGRKPLSQQRMDYYRNRAAFLSRQPNTDAPPAALNNPTAVAFAEHRQFFAKMSVTLDDLLLADRIEREQLNVLTDSLN